MKKFNSVNDVKQPFSVCLNLINTFGFVPLTFTNTPSWNPYSTYSVKAYTERILPSSMVSIKLLTALAGLATNTFSSPR